MTVVFVFVIANLFTATIAISLQYYFSQSMATESAFSRYNITAENTRNYLATLDAKAINTSLILSRYANLTTDNWINPQGDVRGLFAQAMINNPVFYAIYIGFENGDYYELINLDSSPIIRESLDASLDDRWLVVSITGKDTASLKRSDYYDHDFKLTKSERIASSYQANKRPWFVNATAAGVYKTDPYLFSHLKAPGQTYSTILPNSNAVLAVDIALSSLSQYLSSQGINENSEIYLYKPSGEIIATNIEHRHDEVLNKVQRLDLNLLQQQYVDNSETITISNSMDWAPIDFAVSGQPKGYVVDYVSLLSKLTGLKFQYINGFGWPQLVKKFKSRDIKILQAVYENDENKREGILSNPFITLPFGLITKSDVLSIKHINQLIGKKLAIATGWSITDVLRQEFTKIEIIELATLKDVIIAVQQGEVDAGLDIGVILEYVSDKFFIDGLNIHQNIEFSPLVFPESLHFLFQHQDHQLAQIINEAISQVTPAQKAALTNKWLHADINRSSKNTGIVPYAPLINPTFNNQAKELTVIKIGEIEHFVFSKKIVRDSGKHDIFAIVVPVDDVLADSLHEVKLSIVVTMSCLLLLLPISWLFASPIVNPIRLLVQQNKKIQQRKYDEIKLVESGISEINELSLSLNEMSHSIAQQEKSQQELLDSFIRIISQAIDDKSPYTAGHCARVPELAMMLSDYASTSTEPPFKDYELDETERREFNIAAWLHDCGKVTSPEHIIDKGTKLEMIYNRINEIRMRFEVLWRDAEIDYFQAVIKQPDQKTTLQQKMKQYQANLTVDFEFIANANIGGESMSTDSLQRLASISQTTWLRNFDDRLGLSPVELARYEKIEHQLPVVESLLMDKPRHLVERDYEIKFEPHLNIKMVVPQYLYNNGELYNLSISRGTLTAEDRFKINEHIISTIKMLEALPLPPELSKVPRYASTHHETMKGTGYPRKLSAPDLSIPERIMVVADIFEALTAADRPYKEAKPVSVAIDILYKMALDEHIDINVFNLLLSSGIYLEYAQKFLPAKQIDAVDIDKYLKPCEIV